MRTAKSRQLLDIGSLDPGLVAKDAPRGGIDVRIFIGMDVTAGKGPCAAKGSGSALHQEHVECPISERQNYNVDRHQRTGMTIGVFCRRRRIPSACRRTALGHADPFAHDHGLMVTV